MFTLHLLGGARLEAGEGRLRGEPAQRHRLALLALLAGAREGRLPRERLMALLWPEHDVRRARHLLNVSVHVLRKALGGETIRSEGDDLRLDLRRLRCDVVRFREALAREDAREATALYAGPFMDGFFLDEAVEFDQWQAAERAELEERFSAALEAVACAAEAAGDLAEAKRCLERLVRQRPAHAPATLRLMEVLEASGARAEALRAAEDHARVLAGEFGAAPDPEVEALASRMRDAPLPPSEPPAGDAAALPSAPASGSPPVSAGSALPRPAGTPAPGPSGAGRGAPVAAALRWCARRPRWVLAGAVSCVAVFPLVHGTLDPRTEPPAAPSVAVLPFADLSPGGDQGYLSEGLTEELLDALAQTPWLTVAARSSSFRFRGRGVDVRAVGRQLGVAAVVEGSVGVDGDRLRVTTRLTDSRTGHTLWSERYDRRMDDVFSVQEEIARSVARALSAELARRLPDTLVAVGTADPAAYRLYLRGRHEWRKRTEEGMWAAREAFERAIELDPGYAAAYAGLADTWQLLPDYGDVSAAEGLARAKTAALRAVALEPSLAEAHAALGAILDDYDRDRAGSEAAYRRAIDLNPGYATARHWFAIHLADDGRFEEALDQIEQARRLDPLSTIVNTAAGAIRYFARDWAGAAAEYRAVLDLEPDFALAWALLGRVRLVDGRVDEAIASLERAVALSDGDPSYRAVYAAALAAADRTAEARAVAEEVRRPSPDGYVPYCELASAYLHLGEVEQALDLFDRAWEARDPALKHIAVEPLYDRVRGHPRFADLLRRVGFDPPGVSPGAR